jgi:hypothetical protein
MMAEMKPNEERPEAKIEANQQKEDSMMEIYQEEMKAHQE